MKAIVQKTFGIADVIKTVIAPLLLQLAYAFIYGSIAQGTEHANSDMDLMLVGDDISYGAVMELLVPTEQQLGRKINPTLYTITEFENRIATNQHFIKQVMKQPKLWLKGSKT